MSKSITSYTDIFVRKLSQKTGIIMSRDEIGKLWESAGGRISRLASLLGLSEVRSRLIPLSQSYFLVVTPESRDSIDLDDYYWMLIARMSRDLTESRAIIAGEKSAEIWIRDLSIPEVLILYTRETAGRYRISGGREVHFRTIVSGEKQSRLNLFPLLFSTSEKKILGGAQMRILSLEASLLEAASISRHESGVGEHLIGRFLRQYGSRLSQEVLGRLVSYRWIRAANRLRIVAQRSGYESVMLMMRAVIREEGGGCFLSERSL